MQGLKQMAPPHRDLYIQSSSASPMDSVLQGSPMGTVFFSWSNGQHSSGHSEALVYLKKNPAWDFSASNLDFSENYVQKMFDINPEEN